MSREPEIIEFQESVYKGKQLDSRERKKFMVGNVSNIFESPTATKKEMKSTGESSDSNVFNLKETLREVQSLTMSNLTCRKAKRRAEEEQLMALGAKPLKSDYVPYPHHQMMMLGRKNREKRIASETKTSLKKSKKRERPIRGKGRWKDSIKSLDPSIGKFKGGVLKINKKDIAKHS